MLTEPTMLAAVPPADGEIDDAAMYSGREVRRRIAAAVAEAERRGEKRVRNAAFAEARRTFDAALERKVAELEERHKVEREELAREVARQTLSLLDGGKTG